MQLSPVQIRARPHFVCLCPHLVAEDLSSNSNPGSATLRVLNFVELELYTEESLGESCLEYFEGIAYGVDGLVDGVVEHYLENPGMYHESADIMAQYGTEFL